MKIPAALPQFKNETALLIVTGTQTAVLYMASNGEMAKVASLDVPVPHYSDHEGKFASRGHGKFLVSGGVYESGKVQRLHEFLRELVARAKPFMSKYRVTAVYLYSPRYLMPHAKKALAAVIGRRYVMSFQGNYHAEHPSLLLAMISQRQQRRRSRRLALPTKLEADQLLKRSVKT